MAYLRKKIGKTTNVNKSTIVFGPKLLINSGIDCRDAKIVEIR